VPTTDENDVGFSVETPTTRSRVRSAKWKRKSPSLEEFIRMFPTPTVNGNHNRKGLSKNSGDGLATFVKKFPTPRTAGLCGGTGSFRQLKLLMESGVITEEERRNMAQGNGGKLNPEFVEFLMGVPIGWSDLKGLVMPKCRCVQQ